MSRRSVRAALLDGLDGVENWNRRRSPLLRVPLGLLLCLGGALWFLPVLGLWMLPLGLLILSEDVPWLRRRREPLRRRLRSLLEKDRRGSRREG